MDIDTYVNNPPEIEKLYKRTLRYVIISQLLGGAGLAAGITVGALIAQDMLGTDKLSGLPSALFTLGSALAAFLIGQMTKNKGRRLALSMGFITGGIGAIGIILATVVNNIYLLFISFIIYGFGTATNLQARYAGTDLANEKQNATAISMAMVSTTFGAVIGPNLVDFMGNVAEFMRIPKLAGPFILSAVAYISAGLVLHLFLKPDPYIVAQEIQMREKETDKNALIEDKTNKKMILNGAVVMVTTQIIMLAIMTMTPIHMGNFNHSMKGVGFVIGIHIGSMYFPSLVTGMLVNKIGSRLMAILSGVILIISSAMSMLSPGDSLVLLTIALSLLGIGWNFGLISGTTMIVENTSIDKRANVQGNVDVLIAIGGSLAGVLSGVIVGNTSYATLSLLGIILSVLLIVFIMINYQKKSEIKAS